MGDWPLTGDGYRFESAGADTTNSDGASLTAGTANTKGSYVQLIASTAFDAKAIGIYIFEEDANKQDYLVDFAIGASSSEQVILSNLAYSGGNPNNCAFALFPISIPAGSRIAARCQSNAGSATVEVAAMLVGVGFLPSSSLGRVTTYGASTADSGGTSIDPGTSANTKGSYSQLTSSTTNPIKYLFIGPHSANTARSNCTYLVDIAVGAGGSEQIIIPNMPLTGNSSTDVVYPGFCGYPLSIPSGTRLAARAQCNITDASDRLIDLIVYGVD